MSMDKSRRDGNLLSTLKRFHSRLIEAWLLSVTRNDIESRYFINFHQKVLASRQSDWRPKYFLPEERRCVDAMEDSKRKLYESSEASGCEL